MLTRPVVEGLRRNPNPIEAGHGAPEVSEIVRAMLFMAGLRASWSMNFWRVYLPEASQITAQLSGARKRWQTGVGPNATDAEWLAEVMKFWKEAHPGEKAPFGGV